MRKLRIGVVLLLVCGLLLLESCAAQDKQGDISGIYVGKETYVARSAETGKLDVLSFDWKWKLEQGENGMYRVSFEHDATPATGSIAAMAAVKTGINNVPIVDGGISIPNYMYLKFVEIDGQMTAYGTFNVIQSTGETDVRVMSLVRVKR